MTLCLIIIQTVTSSCDAGSSLELAPSLLSIYDNLAASSANDDNDFTGSATPSRVHQDQQTAVNQSRSCVTAAYPGFWITDPDSHHRLFVTSCRDFPGERPVSLMVMEPPGDGDRDKVGLFPYNGPVSLKVGLFTYNSPVSLMMMM